MPSAPVSLSLPRSVLCSCGSRVRLSNVTRNTGGIWYSFHGPLFFSIQRQRFSWGHLARSSLKPEEIASTLPSWFPSFLLAFPSERREFTFSLPWTTSLFQKVLYFCMKFFSEYGPWWTRNLEEYSHILQVMSLTFVCSWMSWLASGVLFTLTDLWELPSHLLQVNSMAGGSLKPPSQTPAHTWEFLFSWIHCLIDSSFLECFITHQPQWKTYACVSFQQLTVVHSQLMYVWWISLKTEGGQISRMRVSPPLHTAFNYLTFSFSLPIPSFIPISNLKNVLGTPKTFPFSFVILLA